MSEWKKVKFFSLFSEPTKNGIYKTKEFHGKGVKIINMGEIFAYSFVGSQEMSRVEISDKERSTFLVRNGDLLFARRSLVESGAGKCAIVANISGETTFESSIIRVRLNEDIALPLFYMYWMRSLQGRTAINGIVTGVNVKGIRSTDLQNIEVDFPTLSTQHRIATILSRYDTLIENYQKQIKLLEEAAQRLYKEWFVDLRFPGYENAKMVDGLPEGWKKKTVGEITPIKTGKKDANFGTDNGEYPFFTCAQEPIKAPSYSFDTSAVILAGNGDFNVKLYRGKFEAYQRTYVLEPDNTKMLYLLYFCISENMNKLATGASGSTIKFLTKGMIESLNIFEPSMQVVDSFNEIVEPIQSNKEHIQSQIRLLTEASDRLLPRLMGREIEI